MKSTHGTSKPKRPTRPTASAAEYRRPLFAVGRAHVAVGATPAISGSESYGFVRVIAGGVTQHHRDLLDVIRAVAEHRITDGARQEHLIFDSAKVRELLPSRVNWRDVREDLLDMLSTVMQLDGDTPGAWGAAFPLATFVGDANSAAVRAPHQFPARLKRLVLSAGFSSLIETHATITLSRDVLAKVLALPNTVSRAVARWCLSHSHDQHHEIARVLAAVGAVQPGEPITGRAASRQARRYVQQLRESAGAFAELGIEIDGLRLHYSRQKGAFITAPGPSESPEIQGVDAKTPVVDAKTPVSKEFPIRKLPQGAGAGA